MDITRWTEDVEERKEYKHRVLVYPNITYQADLERDSYVVVIREALKHLIEARPDVYWVLIVPSLVKSLLEQMDSQAESRGRQMGQEAAMMGQQGSMAPLPV